jgi:predicted transposase YbfD/YdcC
METAGRLRLADVFVSIQDPRQSAKVKHDLVELLVVAVNAVLVGADTFVEIELWAEEKLEWLRGYTPHTSTESVEKNHGRIEIRRCTVFDQLECLDKPQQWKGLRCFVVLESERTIGNKTTHEQRLYISSLAPDAERISQAIRSHWTVENRLHWVMDVSFNDDQMRARTKAAAHNLAVLKHITLNLIRLDPVKRKGSIKTRRIIAATSDRYRAELLGLK